jgi:RHS repeat-associated protein
MRRGSTLTYLHGDHLGSASMTTTALGGVDDNMRYYPYGGTRSGTMATDRRFTGQREETAIGLYDYKARYYDPVIGRFIQADTIVPEPGNPQALNRYAYVYNNPLGYTDPSGHGACSGDDYDIGCSEDFPEQYEFTDEQWQALEY